MTGRLLALPAGYVAATGVLTGLSWLFRESSAAAFFGVPFALVLGVAAFCGGLSIRFLWPGRGRLVLAVVLGLGLVSLQVFTGLRADVTMAPEAGLWLSLLIANLFGALCTVAGAVFGVVEFGGWRKVKERGHLGEHSSLQESVSKVNNPDQGSSLLAEALLP